MSGKPGMGRKKLTPAQKDAIAIGNIESILDGIANKEARCVECGNKFAIKELTKEQVSLLRMRYDKLRPNLSTIEQHMIDERDKLSQDQIVSTLRAIITQSPIVVDSLLQLIAEQQPAALIKFSDVAAHQLQCSNGDHTTSH